MVPREWLLSLLQGAESGDGPDYDVSALAELFGRSESTVRTWCERGEFPGAYRLNGKGWRVPRVAVTVFRERQAQPKPEGGAVDLGDWRDRAPGRPAA